LKTASPHLQCNTTFHHAVFVSPLPLLGPHPALQQRSVLYVLAGIISLAQEKNLNAGNAFDWWGYIIYGRLYACGAIAARAIGSHIALRGMVATDPADPLSSMQVGTALQNLCATSGADNKDQKTACMASFYELLSNSSG